MTLKEVITKYKILKKVAIELNEKIVNKEKLEIKVKNLIKLKLFIL